VLFLDAFAGYTARIARRVLVDRLRTPDEEVFSREERTSTVKRRYKALFHAMHRCPALLQLFEEQTRSLQIRRLKPFREPAIDVLESLSRVV
jgi:hypothetical protein